ncbi:MAG: biopolymer transport protein ExbB/TolQ [Verrucomicrobiales bacterium]|jgi:biopolymer transport protein ExbB/TolQ
MQAEPNSAGKTVKCPGCAAKIKIPDDPTAVKPEAAPPEPTAVAKPSSNLNIPQPTAGALSSPPAPTAVAKSKPAAAEETPVEEHQDPGAGEGDQHHHGPRPIEYFYGGAVGNLAVVNFWISLGIGLGLAVGWFALMHLFHANITAADGSKGNFLTKLFLERSWVQYATTILSTWTIGILILKALHIKRQKRSLLIDIVPQEISSEVNIHNVADFYDHVTHMPRRTHSSFMFHRIRKGLEYFYVRESNAEVASMMSSQSDIDANAISGSYALSKVFLWAIPIMGFIGTVLGIGEAIGQFAKTLAAPAPIVEVVDGGGAEAPAAADATDGEGDVAATDGTGGDAEAEAPVSQQDAMMAGLQDVLSGLGTAFDTTFLALAFSILLMIPASALQASEEDVLNQVDEYCNDNLIKRLNDGSAGGGVTDPSALKGLGEAIAASNRDVVSKFGEIHGNMSTVYDQQTEHYGKVASAVEKQLGSIDTRAKEYETRLDEDFFGNLEKIRKDSVDTISAGIAPLTEGIVELNKLLKELDGKQVKIEKKKRWFFG